MIVESALYSVLSTVTNCNFYPVQLPDTNGKIPGAFGIYTKVGGQSFNSLDGDSGISRVRMQVSIYTTSYSELKTIEYAVNAAMQAANKAKTLINVSSSVPIDGFEADTRRFYVHMDFYIWAEE